MTSQLHFDFVYCHDHLACAAHPIRPGDSGASRSEFVYGEGVLSSAAGVHAQPFLAKLRELADAQCSRMEKAEALFIQAEQALVLARETKLVETERHLAASAAVTAAEDYFASLGTGAPCTDDPAGPESETPQHTADRSGRPVRHLILDVMEVGHAIALTSIYEGVRRLRPGTSEGSIRASLTKLSRSGAVETVTRGVYRLLVIPEDYQADS